jgi:hypothetical protein
MARVCVQATWEDAAHLTRKQKDDLWASIPPYQRDARSKGIPQLGSGAIYPLAEEDITVDPFEIPVHFRRVYGLDVGWNRTAAVWGAVDDDNDTTYLYAEHYRGQAEPAVHAAAIRARGEWIPGVIDPASRGRSQHDGEQLLALYTASIERGGQELNLSVADNAVEAGVFEVWQMLSTGRLKVFKTMRNWLAEYRIYRRDEKGKIVKENDHEMDATRYLVRSGIAVAAQSPADQWHKLKNLRGQRHEFDYDPSGWGK